MFTSKYEHELTEDERLRFARGELPSPYKVEEQPQLPSAERDELRLRKANQNHAMEYIRNGISELVEVIGERETLELAGRAAGLIGRQYGSQTRNMTCTQDGDLDTAAEYLQLIFRVLGDETEALGRQPNVVLRQTRLRIVRGLGTEERYQLLKVWVQLW